jgi:hypothetical protein
MNQLNLIQKLKLQPRLGGTVGDAKKLADALVEGALVLAKEVIPAYAQGRLAVLAYDDANTAAITGIEKQIAVNESLTATYKKVIDRSLLFEERNKRLNDSFGISVANAADLSEQLYITAAALGISGKQAITYSSNLKKIIPTFNVLDNAQGEFYQSLLSIQDQLGTNLKLTDQQVEEYTYYATQNGRNAVTQLEATKKVAASIENETGMKGALKDITEGIAAAAADTQLQFGRLPGTLEMAAIKAKGLGFTLDQMASSGKSMLDIEGSIGKELEYQLLSGHRLIGNEEAIGKLKGKSLTNAYRESAIKGDMNAQMDVMNTILEQEGEVLENNMFARKGMADLLGIDEKSLSRALQKKKMLKSMGLDKDLFKLSDTALTEAASQMLESNEITQEQFNDISKNAQDNRTTEEKMDEQTAIFSDIRNMAFLQMNQSDRIQANALKAAEGNKKLQESMLDLSSGQLEKIGRATMKLDAAEGVASVSTITDLVTKSKAAKIAAAKPADDLIATPTGNSNKILLAGEDTFKLNKNDTVVAGTDLMGGKGGSDNSAGIIAAIQAGFRGAEVKIDESILLRWS